MQRLLQALGFIILCTGLLRASPAQARGDSPLKLETVLPTLPGKNNVRWWEFDWRYTDFTPVPEGAPVRLHFYESERGVAQVAKPFISEAYSELVQAFGYVPTQQIPFLLYNSHFEFQSTRAFLVSEGVLGVTSTQDLTMALPYWGEHQRFQHVMRHELAHQFTIQKLLDRARDTRGCNPLHFLPLWFIEGLAEYYSQPGLTPDVRAVIADHLLARGEDKPEGLPDFFAEGPMGFERIYLMGHAQVRFLEEQYGEGTLRRLMEATPALCTRGVSGFGFYGGGSPPSFQEFLTAQLNTPPQSLTQSWQQWARGKVRAALEARHALSSLELVEDLGSGRIDSFSLSPDGRVLFYRTVDEQTGVARLYLRALEEGARPVLVTQDQRIGLNSLHAMDRRVTAIGDELLAYIGRRGDSDLLFVRRYRREGTRLRLESPVVHDLSKFDGLIEGGYPTISPRGDALAFVGLKLGHGFLDVYRVNRPLEKDATYTQLTDDAYSEQGTMYAPDGTLYFVSDATPDGWPELFRLERTGKVQLTQFEGQVEVGAPSPDAQGGVLFEAGPTGFLQAHRWSPEGVVRVSDVATYLRSPAQAASGELLGLVRVDDERRLARLPRERWLAEPVPVLPQLPFAAGGAGPQPWSIPQAALEEVQEYRPLAPENFNLQSLSGAAAGGPVILGQALFSDQLNTSQLAISALVLGDFDRTNAQAIYLDTSGRMALGGGLLVRTGLQLERDFALTGRRYFLQRIGAAGLLEYPLGRYMRLQGFLSPQALRAFDFLEPGRPFAQQNLGVTPALQGGGSFALDTVRVSPVGPYAGWALSVDLEGTATFGGADPFGMASTELRAFRNVLTGYERFFVHGRVGAGTAFGGALRESFYVPASENLRALRPGSLQLIGDEYYLGQLELHFPLGPPLGGIYLQGVTGVDVGAVAFDMGQLLDNSRAAAVVGANLILGPLALRLHLAQPFALQGGALNRESWITHFTIGTPFPFGPGGFGLMRYNR